MTNYDEALERFHRVDLEYADGLANHGPMGAEALESLGHHALIPAFTDIYVPRLPAREPGRAIGPEDFEPCLGDVRRRADWIATYEARILEGDWATAIASEIPPLLPGLFAGAGHGLLRVAHALRALEREDTLIRRRELAFGLAYWAARFQTLPGLPGSRSRTDPVALERALADWPLVGEPAAREGFFFRAIRRLDSFPAFGRIVERVPLPTPSTLGAYLDALCATGARLYVAQPQARVAYVHAVTIPSALRGIVPYLADRDACLGAGYVLQAVGALHSMYGEPASTPEDDAEVIRVSEDWDEIRYHAACSIQEHSIKMAEACWREDRHRPDPAFRRAAADAALKIEGRGQAALC